MSKKFPNRIFARLNNSEICEHDLASEFHNSIISIIDSLHGVTWVEKEFPAPYLRQGKLVNGRVDIAGIFEGTFFVIECDNRQPKASSISKVGQFENWAIITRLK